MSLELQPVSDETEAAFANWQLLVRLIHKSAALISEAISRLERANRLRTVAPKVTIGKQAAILSIAAEYEAKAHAILAVVPEYHQFFKDELARVGEKIEGGIGND